MGYFDDLSLKLSAVGQSAANQAKVFAESTRINMKISDEEKQINALYAQIGKQYFEENKDNPNATYANLIGNIKDTMQRIDNYKDEVRRTKGIRVCPNCNCEVGASATFCDVCGTQLPPQQNVQGNSSFNRCPMCKSLILDDSPFCTVCGHALMPNAAAVGVSGLGAAANTTGVFSTPDYAPPQQSVNTAPNTVQNTAPTDTPPSKSFVDASETEVTKISLEKN